MDIFKRINHNNLKQDKRKSLTLIIAIAISTCLFTMVATFMMNIVDAVEDNIKRETGNYYISMSDKNDVKYNKFIKNKDVEHIAKFHKIGECYIKTSGESSRGTVLIAGDKKSLETMNIELVKGKLPTDSSEIILPIDFEYDLYENGEIGSYVTLKDENDVLSDNGDVTNKKFKKQYKIVGYFAGNIINRYYKTSCIYSGYDSSIQSGKSTIFVKLKDGLIDTKVNTFINKYNIKENEYKKNTELLSYKGLKGYKQIFSFYMLIFGGFYIIATIVSIIIVSNAITISFNNKRRQMGLLASVGATKKQLKNMMLHEVRGGAIIGIPVGVIIGSLIMYILSYNFLSDIFKSFGSNIDFKFKWSLFAILLILLFESISILLATIKPNIKIKKMNIIAFAKENEEIDNNKKRKKEGKFIKKLGVEGLVADKYYNVDNKKYKRTMRGLAFSMVIFIISVNICNMIEKAFDDSLKVNDYDIVVSSGYKDMSDIEAAYKRSIMQYTNAKDSIKSVRGIKNKYFYCEDGDAEEIGIINKSDLNENELKTIKEREKVKSELPDKIGYFIKNIYVDEDMYKDIIKKNNLDERKYINNPNPKGILYNVRNIENSEKTRTILTRNISNIVAEDSTAIYAREDKIGENYRANYNIWPILIWNDLEDHMVNDMMITYMSEDKNEKDIKEPLITKNIEFDDIINNKIEGFKNDDYDTIYLIYPDTMVEKVNEYSVVINASDYSTMKSDLKIWMKDNKLSDTCLTDIILINNISKLVVLFISAFAYIFVILMTIMAIANVLNIISTNFYYRRRDYAMIQSVGMSDKGLRKMLIYECLNYGIRAFMTGLPISIILSVLIKLASGELKSYFAGSNVFINILTCIKNILPWGAVGISVLVIFAVVFLSMLYSIHEIKKESIIDTIKSTDI